nr:hypothetical protein [Halomarina sp. BND7]
MSGDEPPTTGPPDRQTLRLLERRLADEPLVETTAFDPDAYEPQLLRARLDAARYPSTVEAARLDVRWFTSGDFSVQYVETAANGVRWTCRWDRHPNSHDPRLHFHRPPDGTSVEGLSLESVHPLDVLSTVLAAVERRVAQRWDAGEE